MSLAEDMRADWLSGIVMDCPFLGDVACSVVGLPLTTHPSGFGASRKLVFKGARVFIGHAVAVVAVESGRAGTAAGGTIRGAALLSWKYLPQPSLVRRSPGWFPGSESWASMALSNSPELSSLLD